MKVPGREGKRRGEGEGGEEKGRGEGGREMEGRRETEERKSAGIVVRQVHGGVLVCVVCHICTLVTLEWQSMWDGVGPLSSQRSVFHAGLAEGGKEVR